MNDRLTVYVRQDISELASILHEKGGFNYDTAIEWFEDGGGLASGSVRETVLAIQAGSMPDEEWPKKRWQNHFESLVTEALLMGGSWYTAPYWLQTGVPPVFFEIARATRDGRTYARDSYWHNAAKDDAPRLDSPHLFSELDVSRDATQLLLHGAGIRAFLDFAEAERSEATWQRDFERAFGISISKFYDYYEEHWYNGLPSLDIPSDIGDVRAWPLLKDLPKDAPVEQYECSIDFDNNTYGNRVDAIEFAVFAMCDFLSDQGLLKRNLKVYVRSRAADVITVIQDECGWTKEDSTYLVAPSSDSYVLFLLGVPGCAQVSVYSGGYKSDINWFDRRLMNEVLEWLAQGLVTRGRDYNSPDWIGAGIGQVFAEMARAYRYPTRSYQRDPRIRDTALNSSSRIDRMDVGEQEVASVPAVELLAHGAGIGAFEKYFRLTGDTNPARLGWDQEFELAFGISLTDFYSLYETLWRNGLPEIEIPQDVNDERSWPNVSELPTVYSVDTLTELVTDRIVQVTSQGRIGSGFVAKTEPDGTVWILTNHSFGESATEGTVDLTFFNEREPEIGTVHTVNQFWQFALIRMCCRQDVKAVDFAPMPTHARETDVTVFAAPRQDSVSDRPIGRSETLHYDGFQSLWVREELDDSFVGGPAFNRIGQVFGMVVDDVHNGERELVRVDALSFSLDFEINQPTWEFSVETYDIEPELPEYLTIARESELTAEEARALRVGAKLIHDMGVALDLPIHRERITIYADQDSRVLASDFAREERISVQSARRALERIEGFSGFARENAVYLRVMHAGLLVHELTHTMFQTRLSSGSSPNWMVEGMAVYFSHLADRFAAKRSLSWARSDFYSNGDYTEVPPKVYAFEGWHEGGCDYNCGHAAVELLASRVGIRGLVSFFENGRAGVPWQTTFQQTFGLTVAEFYDLFATHMEAGFPILEIPDDPFPEN